MSVPEIPQELHSRSPEEESYFDFCGALSFIVASSKSCFFIFRKISLRMHRQDKQVKVFTFPVK